MSNATLEVNVSQVVVFVAPPEAVSILRAVLAGLPMDFQAAMIFLVHAGTGSERPVANNLNVNSGLMVLPGAKGVHLRRSRAYVVSADAGLAIGGDGTFISAIGKDADDDALLMGEGSSSSGESEPLLTSLAARYGSGVVAVALTAIAGPEAEGFRRIRTAGGHTIALNESDRLWADSSGPRVVPDAADEYLSARDIGNRIVQMLGADPVGSIG